MLTLNLTALISELMCSSQEPDPALSVLCVRHCQDGELQELRAAVPMAGPGISKVAAGPGISKAAARPSSDNRVTSCPLCPPAALCQPAAALLGDVSQPWVQDLDPLGMPLARELPQPSAPVLPWARAEPLLLLPLTLHRVQHPVRIFSV